VATKRSILSDATKRQFAHAQGVTPEAPGSYGNLTSRQAGNFVKLAIQAAEQQLANQVPAPAPAAPGNPVPVVPAPASPTARR
jgi:small acid-soluble spore protein F (minor alpha/beta-type SASP)